MASVSWEGLSEQALTTLIGYALGGAITPVLAPLSQSAASEAWSLLPVLPLSPADLAAMVVQGVLTQGQAQDIAVMSGVSNNDFDLLVKVNGSPPGPQDLLSMWDRKIISEDDVRRGLLQSRLKPEWVDFYIATNPALLQIADLAEMVVQGVMSQDDATVFAGYLSYSPTQFDQLVLLAGSPPGNQTALEMWNRGIIEETEVDTALLQSRLKPQWVESVKAMRYQPLSLATAVEGVLRARMDVDVGREIANKNGLASADFDMAVDISGRSMGVGQALQLARRGDLDYNGFYDIIARSDVKTEYAPDLWKLRVAIPGIIQVKQLVSANALPDDIAITLLMDDGYEETIATAVVKAAHTTKTTATKHVAAGTIEVLYVAGIESHDIAIQELEKLNYDEAEAEEYLESWTARRIASELVHAVSVVRSKYTGWKITAVEARADLVDFGLDSPTVERLIKWWADERTANTPQLTHAEVTTGFKYSRYTYTEATQLLLTMGWNAADALTLLWNTMHGDPRLTPAATTPTTPVVVTPPPTITEPVDTGDGG